MINKATILGTVGKDPEIKQTQSGAKICHFSVATNESWKDKDGEKQVRTEWHKIVVYNENMITNLIEKYVKKGSLVHIEGKITTTEYEKDGSKRFSTQIVLNNLQHTLKLISTGKNKSDEKEVNGNVADIIDDEIPF